jgi:hypothetical protein
MTCITISQAGNLNVIAGDQVIPCGGALIALVAHIENLA